MENFQVLNCEICNQPIANAADGVLTIDEAEIREFRPEDKEVLAYDTPYPYEKVHWRWMHQTCEWAANVDRPVLYSIEGQQIPDMDGAAQWTLRLRGKNWFCFTDWYEVMGRLFALLRG